MQGTQAGREVKFDQAKPSRPGRQSAPPVSSMSFGQVTTSRRKGSEHAALRNPAQGARRMPETREDARDQRQKKDLLSQLQRLQLLQQEAQELL